jgi:hypothetical protein
MSSVPDITQAEQWAVEPSLIECRPDRHIELQPADVEIKMYPRDRELTVYPAVLRETGSTSIVITNVADRTCRSHFCNRGFQPYGASNSNYDGISDRVVTRLQVARRQVNQRP